MAARCRRCRRGDRDRRAPRRPRLGRGESASSGLHGRLLQIDPSSDRVTASLPVGDGAEAVAVGSGRVWVASYRAGTLTQVDPRSGARTSGPAIGMPHDVTLHAGKAYVAALGPVHVRRQRHPVRRGQRRSHGRGDLPYAPCSLASGTYGVWIAGCPTWMNSSSMAATWRPESGDDPERRPPQRGERPRGHWAAWRWARARSG